MYEYYKKNKLKEKYKQEQVYVLPFCNTKTIPDRLTIHKLSISSCIKYLKNIEKDGTFICRNDAEENNSIQQLIPYTIIFNKNMDVYTSYRIDGDKRLNNVYSLGFGGHINPKDNSYIDKSLIFNAAKRELEEEVNIKIIYEKLFLGTVRDLSSNTKEHLGFIFAIKTNNNVSIREKDKQKGKWMTIKDLYNKYYLFESWSRFIIDYLFVLQKKNKLKDLFS